jgi:capsular polysaccharide transport system permease protein
MKLNIRNYLNRTVKTMKQANKLFVFLVLLPTVLGVVYFGFIAPDVYVSESHFVVRNQQHQSVGGLSTLLQGTGLSQAGGEDAYSVEDYITSRDALQRLNASENLNAAFGRGDVEALSRFPGIFEDKSFESLLRYYRKHIVETDFDSTSSIMTLTVRAFSAEEAFKINETLLKMSEEFVNQLNERGRNDLMKFSISDVADAEKTALTAVQAVSSYRNGEEVFDPEKQSALQLEGVGKLQEELLSTQKQLADVRAVAPQNPQIPVLENRINVLGRAIRAETSKVAGGRESLSTKSAVYEAVSLQRDFAAKRLELAQASLQLARENALKQQIYIERVQQPNKPDEAIEPKRLRNIAATVMLSLMLFAVVSLFVTGVKDHVS